ncbi:hypothetical protein [Streptosporangium sp. NPDC049376]|uniref:hypothetical protein n=1 Tax=Streptosporangium sp. NPDC049376 TaxID=3366192 RepID=UPI00379B171D
MEAELVALASAGAATLVELMISDSWAQVKDGVARLLARDGETGHMTRRLDASREEIAAIGETRDAVEADWRARLYGMLRSDPALAEELRRLLGAPERSGDVHNVVSGGVQYGPVIQSGSISGLIFHDPDRGSRRGKGKPGEG